MRSAVAFKSNLSDITDVESVDILNQHSRKILENRKFIKIGHLEIVFGSINS